MAIKHRGLTFTGYNKPRRAEPGASKKFVVAAKKGDQVKLVRFGAKGMSIKKNQPARKASYCARSGGIKGTSDKFSANYWSRRKWDC